VPLKRQYLLFQTIDISIVPKRIFFPPFVFLHSTMPSQNPDTVKKILEELNHHTSPFKNTLPLLLKMSKQRQAHCACRCFDISLTLPIHKLHRRRTEVPCACCDTKIRPVVVLVLDERRFCRRTKVGRFISDRTRSSFCNYKSFRV
jgi:hypothetical protein